MTSVEVVTGVHVLSVFVVEADARVTERLESVLRVDRRFVIAGESADVNTAASWQEPFDIAVIDLNLSGLDGAGPIAALHRRHPAPMVVVLSVTGRAVHPLRRSGRRRRRAPRPARRPRGPRRPPRRNGGCRRYEAAGLRPAAAPAPPARINNGFGPNFKWLFLTYFSTMAEISLNFLPWLAVTLLLRSKNRVNCRQI